ncbi:hypothetical protein [Streptomyces sp. NBC_01217]|uniref:hypothetical protein n=1 Tax=Streptomyces sp. NBC_01217 TaxID=2903779 RepID=UPI002E1540AD|nr:hypothetical protein OG507_09095 [Streptomyces sp. NBC_01217]
MTEVLHLQSRAYPVHHSSPPLTVESFHVPGHGELRANAGELGTLGYNPDFTIELDLKEIVTRAIALPGTEIVDCHARILSAGSILVTYALRHEADLRRLALADLDALDARVNHALREADAPILAAVLAAAVAGGLVQGLALRPDLAGSGGDTPVDRQSARYNCHFVTESPPWETDPRLPPLSPGPFCKVLLPYTYAWDRDPATALHELRTMLEPTDIATAQQSLLVGALLGGRRVLVDLARAEYPTTDVHAFRRFLDGVWSDYHHLDGYRIESAQGPRATYLAARESIGLDNTQERADKLLGYVGNSLLAAASQRTEALDTRLNRVASALAMVTAASFSLDVAVFLLPDVSLAPRIGVVSSLIGLAAVGIAAVFLPVRRMLRASSGIAGVRSVRSVRAVRVPGQRPAGPAAVRPAPEPDGSGLAGGPSPLP